MSLHRRRPSPATATPPHDEEPYNIIPVHNLLADHPSLRYPEVRAAAAAIRAVGNLRRPPFGQWRPHYDLLDWLALFFGFQKDNVRNQREHLVLHLANAQMRLTPPPDNIDTLDAAVLRRFRKKLLKNYASWCSYLGKKSNVWISGRSGDPDLRRELLYVSLYLLIWGEAANLRFAPECICYIFHNMANELNRIMEDYIDDNTGQPVMPSISGENAFLNFVVKPIYETISREVDNSRNGTAPHSAWRNYDDINEYFWSRRCFEKLKWPPDVGSNFFAAGRGKHVGKTGFVEQRSFWNLFRSFDRLWVMLVLFLQAAIIVAWEEKTYPWQALEDRTVQVKVLTIFFTWSGMRFVLSLLDVGMQYRLVSRETMQHGVRMVLKCIVAAGWIVVFGVFYARIWTQRNNDRRWSPAANRRVVNFLEVVFVFIIPELLALALFILPWIRNFVENTNWKIFYMLSWWFQSRSFVGRGLREGLVDNIKYSLFWVLVLATKFCFSYFLQVKPMIAPTKAVLKLKNVDYEWHQFFHDSNRFAAGLLWVPVVLIYLMDIQIWYSIYSSFVGAAVGLFAHLGEIRNMQQLKLRFQFFASAIQFNLMPEEQLMNARGTLKSKFKDAIHRLKLRYGIGRPFKKLESNQVEANKFALIWNEIILSFREEDIISDREVELLELPQNSWNVRVIRWPCFLLCNELLLALSQAKELVNDTDKRLYTKICKNEYRRCSVIEAYDSVKHLLLEIVKPNSEEHSIVTVLFQEIDHSLEIEKFTKTFKTTALPQLHSKLIRLADLLNKPVKNPNQVVNTLQALYEIAIRDFFKDRRHPKQLEDDGLAQSVGRGIWPGDEKMSPDWNYGAKSSSHIKEEHGQNKQQVAPGQGLNQNAQNVTASHAAGQSQAAVSIAPPRARVIEGIQNHELSAENKYIVEPNIMNASLSQIGSRNTPTPNGVSNEQLAQLSSLSASLAHILGTDRQLPQLHSTLNSADAKETPFISKTEGSGNPDSVTFIKPDPAIGLKQYDTMCNSMEPKNTNTSGVPSTFSPSTKIPKNAVEIPQLLSNPGQSFDDSYKTAISEELVKNEHFVQSQQGGGIKVKKDNNEMVAEEKPSSQTENKIKEDGPLENMDKSAGPVEEKKMKDVKVIRAFKNSLVEFIKELLKPTWKEGKINKEDFKAIVKKVTDKVTDTVEKKEIPQTQEKIDRYLSVSKPKLNKLVQAYVDKIQKP